MDAKVVAEVMYRMHRYATENMGELESKGGPIHNLPLEVRQFLAKACTQIVGDRLYEGCTIMRPEKFEGCDFSVTIVNLYQIIALAIQYDDDKNTNHVYDALNALRDAGFKSEQVAGIIADVGQYSREHNLTLRDVSAIVGPSLFKVYRETVPTDYVVEYYEKSAAERRAAGYNGDMDPVRRIQYICVVLNNNGAMQSDVLRQCVAIAMGPDFRNMDHVKAYTKEMSPDIYKHLNESIEGWTQQQKLLMDAETKVLQEDAASSKKKKVNAMHCMACGNVCTTRCSACKRVFYCSRACQKKNWQAHKPDCTPKENK